MQEQQLARSRIPVSLRSRPSHTSTTSRTVTGLSLAAAMGVLDGSAMAQSASAPTRLPTMTVGAPTPRASATPTPSPTATAGPVVSPAAPAAGSQAAPVAAAPTGETSTAAAQQGAAAGTPSGPAPGANPYANPEAPYKVERSSSLKFTQPLIDTPRTMVVVPKEVLRDKAATSIRDLVRTMPGMTLGSGEGGNAFGDRVFIRGFDARNDMYINGIRESGVTTRETFMAEQVEVLEGPAGAIAGRGTTGGAINIVTKRPQERDFYTIDVTGGTDATKRITADINQTLSDKFQIRINGLFQQADVAGRDNVFDNRYGASIAAQWKPVDNLRIFADYYFVYLDQMPDWGVPFDPRTRKPFTESGVDRSGFYGIARRDFQRNYQHMATAGAEWAVTDALMLSSRFRYSHTVTDYVAGKPGTPNLSNPNWALWTVPSTPASRYQVNKTIANQTDATYKFELWGLKHSLVTGLEVSREEVSQDTYSNLAIECFPACTSSAATGINYSLFWPQSDSIAALGTPTRNGRPTLTNVNTVSVYALDTINWNDRLYVNFGGRLDNYAIDRTPFGGATISRTDLMFNWNGGVLYKVLPNLGAYFAIGTSSNPVGSELDGTADDYGGLTTANKVFKPEQNTAIEAGLKWEVFEKRLLLTAALFQTTKDNARETIGTGATATLQDSAAYRVRGVQLGVAGNITEQWSVWGGAVFLNSEVTESANPATLGQPLANIAHQSFNLLTKYKVTDKLTLGGQATYKSEIFGGTLAAVSYAPGTVNVGGVTTATPGGYNRLPPGWRFDLLADYKINDTFTASLRVVNVFDARLYDAFYRSQTPYVYIAPGRAAYLTVRGTF